MRLYKYIIILAGCATGLLSCAKDEPDTFSGKGDVYFYNFAAGAAVQTTDSLAFTFAFAKGSLQDSVINVAFRATGPVSATDRQIKLSVTAATSAIAGKHFEALPANITLHAGRVTDTFQLRLLRTADLKTTPVVLELELQPNENFGTQLQYRITNPLTGARYHYTTYRIIISDILVKPISWIDGYFGTFTAKKLFLMCGLVGISPDYLNVPNLSLPERTYFATFTHRYLLEQAAAGHPILEDDGSPMTMGSAVQ
ncbi:DUF4843 domain-containing protein [Chitinophaga lutea]